MTDPEDQPTDAPPPSSTPADAPSSVDAPGPNDPLFESPPREDVIKNERGERTNVEK